ncbi:MAG TPA: FecR domain-containing protein [Polyangia bacterium]|nr:FecR domain-containing protein [Polyangia bacterium]
MNLVNGDWQDTEARRLVERARQRAVAPAPSAKARVWARVEKRRVQPRWRLAWPMFALGAACATLLVLLLVPRDRPDSRALVIASDGVQRTVKPGEKLPTLNDLSLVDLHGAGRMVAGPGTLATLDRLGEGGAELHLERGSLLMHVTPRPQRAPFLVKTARFTAKVVGTVLRVVVHADGSASLAVGHGAVELTPVAGKPVMVRSGERWPASAADAPSSGELDRLGATDLEGVTAASFAPSPAAAAPTSPACSGALAPDERLRCNLELGDESDPLKAEGALYEAGWIAMRDLGQPARALAIWQKQRARFPSGVLRREVHASVIDALVSLHRSTRARAEIDSYLAADPNGLRAPEMHFVRGTLLREADRGCRRALREFNLALERPSEPWARNARIARASCKR